MEQDVPPTFMMKKPLTSRLRTALHTKNWMDRYCFYATDLAIQASPTR